MKNPNFYEWALLIALIVWAGNSYITDKNLEEKICSLDSVVCKDEEVVDDNAKFRYQREGETYSNMGMKGVASWYDYELDDGWSSVGHYVCASRNHSKGATLIVRDMDNGRMTRCLVTDYGPDYELHPDRIIDLSSTAFKELRPLHYGLTNVLVQEVFGE